MRSSQWTALAAVALCGTGCMAVADNLRADFVEPTTEDAASLSIAAAPGGQTTLLTAVVDPVTCEGNLNLGGSMRLQGERTVRLPPGEEFAFAVTLFANVNGEARSCEQMVVFTPEARTEYRARALGDPKRCHVQLVKVVAGTEVTEMGARHRMMRSRDGRAPSACVD